MGLKFRRGTTAQKSGSLAFGEPYVNTTLGTLQIGGDTGDITLGASGTGSQGSFAGISGSSLDITGNAKIDGNLTLGGAITIGDASADTVNVIASLSSSLIPQTTNAFDLGSATKIWRDLYISTGSIKFVEGTTVVKSLSAATLTALETSTGSQDTKNTTLATYTGSVNSQLSNLNTATSSYETKGRGIVSGSSQVTGIGNAQLTNSSITIGSTSTALGATSTTIAGLVSVTSTGFTGALTGNASTATTLATARTINGTSFDGGANITIPNLVSGSAQITYASVSSIPAGIISGSSQLSGTTITDLTVVNLTTVNETASVIFSSGSNRFGDAGNDTHSFTGSVQISGSLTTIGTSTATSYNGTINATNGVVSGSSQISHDSTTGYSANKHIDHTSVLISAGNGLSGGGDISSTRTLTLDSGSAHFTGGVKTKLNAETVISGSSQVTGISNAQLTNSTISGKALGTNLDTLTIGTGLSGTSYNGSGAVTIANTGVTSNVAGTGITVSGATGAVTITNAGVTSAVAGTGVTVSGATGAVTVSIGQAVGTASTPTFGNLTINGTITATGDITAFFTSDIRHKNNVQLIDNALDKVNALNGVTWEWNDDVDEVTKQTPKTGLIAQDVLDVLPEVVKTRENGFLALDYSKMIGLLVEAIKEQDIVIQKLKSDMVGLSTTITVFEDRMKEKGLL